MTFSCSKNKTKHLRPSVVENFVWLESKQELRRSLWATWRQGSETKHIQGVLYCQNSIRMASNHNGRMKVVQWIWGKYDPIGHQIYASLAPLLLKSKQMIWPLLLDSSASCLNIRSAQLHMTELKLWSEALIYCPCRDSKRQLMATGISKTATKSQ